MDTASKKELSMEFLLDLLRDEREKRQAAEQEVETLRAILQPLQQEEMDRIIARRLSQIENIKKIHKETQPECKPVAGGSTEKELGTYVRNKFPRKGRIVCDCGCTEQEPVSYDEID